MPALATRRSMRPWRLVTSAAAFATCALSATSHRTPSKPAFFRVASLRPETTTVAPSFFSAMAPANPMPEAPPVIHATLPSSSPLGILGAAEQHLRLLLAESRRLAAALGEHLDAALH